MQRLCPTRLIPEPDFQRYSIDTSKGLLGLTRGVRMLIKSFAIALGFLFLNPTPLSGAETQDSEANYDRLDGMGKSRKKVDVIEWEGNLEIHVYPKGSLAGLSLKLDKPSKEKLVMVIGYRFSDNPKTQLIRRAILGIPIQPGFKAFKDPSEADFDKIIISNNGLSNQVVAFQLDPEPSQLYPDGHPALAEKPEGERKPAGTSPKKESKRPNYDEDGTIKPFGMGE